MIEHRTYKIELRTEPESRTIRGMAAVTGVETDLGWFIERIEPGAFDNADISDVRALFNHDPNFILARSKSGTLKLEKKSEGLAYEFEAPNTTAGNDLLESMRRGDIDQSSFAFTIRNDKWQMETRDGKEVEVRVIQEIERVYDVSPVTYPAYETATATLASKDAEKVYRSRKEDLENEAKQRRQMAAAIAAATRQRKRARLRLL